jgi:hypothetical protein
MPALVAAVVGVAAIGAGVPGDVGPVVVDPVVVSPVLEGAADGTVEAVPSAAGALAAPGDA